MDASLTISKAKGSPKKSAMSLSTLQTLASPSRKLAGIHMNTLGSNDSKSPLAGLNSGKKDLKPQQNAL